MRRSFSTLGCPALSLGDVLKLAADYGIDAVELRTLEGTTDLPALFGRLGETAILNALDRNRKVQAMVLSTSFRLVDPSAADRAALLSFVPWAEAMGVPWLRVFDGGSAADKGTAQKAADTLRWWRRMRSEHRWGVDVIVETHDGLVTHELINRVCSEVGDVRVLWDAHNTWRATGIDPLDLWPRIADHVIHIHVKDSVSRASDGFPYTYVLPGDGEFPMSRLREALTRDGYGNAVSLEWERQWHPDLPPLEAALQAASERGWW
jgi:sugar phosphate isomerase/epimerase